MSHTSAIHPLQREKPKESYRVYTHAMRLEEEEREQLRALVEGTEWPPLGTRAETEEETEATEVWDSAL
jgi:hypothetical protein